MGVHKLKLTIGFSPICTRSKKELIKYQEMLTLLSVYLYTYIQLPYILANDNSLMIMYGLDLVLQFTERGGNKFNSYYKLTNFENIWGSIHLF